MADVQPQEGLQPVEQTQPAVDVSMDTINQGLKRSASEEAGEGQPEAKQARLDEAAAERPTESQGAAIEDLLPKVESQVASVPAVAAGEATAPEAAQAHTSTLPAAAAVKSDEQPQQQQLAQEQAQAEPAAVAPTADAPAAVADGSNIQSPREGGGGRGRGRGRGRDRDRGSVDANMAGQEPTGDASKFKMPADAILKQEIPLQRRMASCVIGIKGQSVTKLRRESGAKIHVRPGQGATELDQVVEIEGSIEAVLTCIRMIDDLLRAEDPNYKMAPKPEVTSRFYVLPEMIGPAIIGKAGTHAKHIRERTGVRIEVVPPADGATRQHIVLHGTAERVREAYHLLLGNIRKYGPNLPSGAVPAPLPFPHRPPPATTPGGGGGGRGGGRYGNRSREGSAGRGSSSSAQPPPPPRGGRAPYRYEEYATADPYRAAAPATYAAPAAAPAAYAAPAGYATADPAAAAAAAGGQQLMYILQDGVLKPLTVMYQQPGAAAAPAAPAVVAAPTGYGAAGTQAYAAAPAAAAPTSTGGAVVYQQPGAAATYTYAAAPASTGAGGAADAAAAAGGWAGAVQQIVQATSSSAPVAVASYPTAGQAQQYTVPSGTQYVQYTYPQQ